MIDTDKYEGHTPAQWETNSCDSQGVWQEHDESIPRHIAMVHSDQNWEDMSETEFTRMMADKHLIADAPLLLAEVKRLVLVADELYLHIVGEPHMTLSELVAEMWWRDEEE